MSKKKNDENQEKKPNKKLYLGIILAAILLIAAIIFIIKRGTFSLESHSATIGINCDSGDGIESNLSCAVTLSSSTNGLINGVKANYSLPTGFSYVSFEPGIDCDESSDCIVESTENGFVVGTLDGFDSSSTIGTFEVSLPSNPSGSYQIRLTNIELSLNNAIASSGSDEGFDALDVDDVIVDIVFDSSGSTSSGSTSSGSTSSGSTSSGSTSNIDVSFSSDIKVDDENKILSLILRKSITSGTEILRTYNDVISSITTTGTINVESKSGSNISNTSVIKTNDVIKITSGSDSVSYKVSVLGDVQPNSKININDVTALYWFVKKPDTLTDDVVRASCNIINDNKININDVTRLYWYMKGKYDTLEVVTSE